MIKTTTCARLRRAHVVVGDIEMSWETADVLAADTADVLAADTRDVLAADITMSPCSCCKTSGLVGWLVGWLIWEGFGSKLT